MLKRPESMKYIEQKAAEALLTLLKQVPVIDPQSVYSESRPWDGRYDFVVTMDFVDGQHRTLVCEVKPNGQPRHVRNAALALRDWVNQYDKHAIPVLIAPYLSNEARTICIDQQVGFLDFEGNCRLTFDGIYIERQVPTKPAIERRDLKSLFTPKSAQVLRLMLRDPDRQWRVTDISQETAVSVGHVSNVRNALIEKEWAEVGEDGLRLTNPDALLDVWREAYEPPAGERMAFYTTLHGRAFDEALRHVFDGLGESNGLAMLASFSAARWQAPYAKSGSQFFYANQEGLNRIKRSLNLASAVKGENVVITVLDDDGLFKDIDTPAPGIFCTSLVQTYLDLSAAGERGQEAADHLRHQKLIWKN